MENKWYSQAVESFKRAVTKDGENSSYMNNWALALYHKGMSEDNLEDLNSSLEKL